MERDAGRDGAGGEPGLVSIGRLAEATGISPDRLRIWERRYGRPQPVRLASGHRRYSAAEIARLRRVADLLARGLRPGKLLTLEDGELEALHLEVTAVGPDFEGLEEFLGWVGDFSERELASALADVARTMPTRKFLSERVTPLLIEVGTRWADGRLDICHEHFAAGIARDHMAALRAECEAPAGGSPVILATLPGERHGLALEMLDLITALEGVPSLALGVETPPAEIARAAAETGASAVAISISLAQGGPVAVRALRELRAALAERVELVVGGSGMLGRGPRGVRVLRSLEGFERWLRTRRGGRTPVEEIA